MSRTKRLHRGKKRRQEAQRVAKADPRGVHRKRRERCALPGRMIHQEGRTHEWVSELTGDWILTLDEATREHDWMFFVEAEGTASSMRGVREGSEARPPVRFVLPRPGPSLCQRPSGGVSRTAQAS